MARNMKPLAIALGATLAASMVAQVNAAENPFSSTPMVSGYKVAMEGKCGEGKCGATKTQPKADSEGKCGDAKAAPATDDTTTTDAKSEAEGKCGGKK
jgi:uncharacterized low-complexity protein